MTLVHHGLLPVDNAPPDVVQAIHDYLSGIPTPGYEVIAHAPVIRVLGPDREWIEVPDRDNWEIFSVWEEPEENHDPNRYDRIPAIQPG